MAAIQTDDLQTSPSPNYDTGQTATPSSTPAPTAAQAAQDASASQPQQGQGFLSRVGGYLYNNMARPAPTYSVDDKGTMTSTQGDATPGQFFKNALVGALIGMAKGAQAPRGSGILGGVGAGAEGVMQYGQQADQQAQNRAITQHNLQQQAQSQADEHTLQTAQLNKMTLDNAKMTHDMNFADQMRPLQLSDAKATLDERQMSIAKSAMDMGLSNPRRIDNYGQLGTQDAQDISSGKKIALTNFDGSATLYDLPSDPYKTTNSKPFEIATWSANPKTGKPTRTVIGTVDSGNGTVAQQLAALNSENKSYADVNGKYLDGKVKMAEVGHLNAEIANARAALDDRQRKIQLDNAQGELGKALAQTGNDVNAAFDLLRKNNPTAYGTLAAIDAMNKNMVETTTTDKDTGETTKTRKYVGIVPGSGTPDNTTTQGATGTTTTPTVADAKSALQQQILGITQAQVAQGYTRDQINTMLRTSMGDQAGAMMQYLDSKNVFKHSQQYEMGGGAQSSAW